MIVTWWLQAASGPPASELSAHSFWLQALSSKLRAGTSQLLATSSGPSSKLEAHSSWLQALSSKLRAPSWKLTAPSSKLKAVSFQLGAWSWELGASRKLRAGSSERRAENSELRAATCFQKLFKIVRAVTKPWQMQAKLPWVLADMLVTFFSMFSFSGVCQKSKNSFGVVMFSPRPPRSQC